MEDENEFELNDMLHEIEGDVVEEGDRVTAGPAKNILDKRSASLSAASLRTRAEVLPAHLQGKFRTVVCRHWMRGECHKGDKCEFLHKMVGVLIATLTILQQSAAALIPILHSYKS